jgi:mycofactocin precursor
MPTVGRAGGNVPGMDDDVTSTSADDNTLDAQADELVDELLIEEISIDGMCGVY